MRTLYGFKIMELFAFLLLGAIITSGVLFIIPRLEWVVGDEALKIRIMTFVQGFFVFLMPALAVAVLDKEKWVSQVGLKLEYKMIRLYLWAVLILFVALPCTAMLTNLNLQMQLPDTMHSVEQWMRNAENEARLTTEKLFASRSFSNLLGNLFVVAFFAAFVEEVFFRGALQRYLRLMLDNRHLTVFVVAFVFSFLHFQFYGFLPRLFLGLILGYLYEYSRNLWTSIFVHFVNNAMVVLNSQSYSGTDWAKRLEDSTISVSLVIFGILSLFATYYMFSKYRKLIKRINTSDSE